MEIPDELLKEALDHGWVAMAMHERANIADLSRQVAQLEALCKADECTIARLMDEAMEGSADLVIELMERRRHDSRLVAQRKEIRALHKKIERLEEELAPRKMDRREDWGDGTAGS